jgi:glycosyltransferase involved in cell wall biosynthesis
VTNEQSGSSPLVSIGVFLYNEERFLRDTLQSLLAQDYPNIEFIVSDNCSTDSTAEICEDLLSGDPRATFERLDENIGAAANSIRVLHLAVGEYFMWASGHDLWAPGYVSACVAELEAHPEAALAYGPSDWIDKAGAQSAKESGIYDTRGMDALIRLFFAFWGNLHPVLGVIRTRCLKELPEIRACAGSDQIVLAELALAGEFIFVPGAAWIRRSPRDPETHKQRIERYTSAEFGLARSWIDRKLPLLRLPLAIARAVYRSELRFSRKLAAILALLPAFLVRYLAAKDAA